MTTPAPRPGRGRGAAVPPETDAAHGVDRDRAGRHAGVLDVGGAAGDGAGGAHGGHQRVQPVIGGLGDLAHRARGVGAGVRRIAVLEQVHRAGDLLQELLDPSEPRRQQIAGLGVRLGDQGDLPAERPDGGHGGGVGARVHHAHEAHPVRRAHPRQGDPEVARAGFDDRAAGGEAAAADRVAHHRERRAVLGAAAGIHGFQLGEDLDARVGEQVVETDQRGAADGSGDADSDAGGDSAGRAEAGLLGGLREVCGHVRQNTAPRGPCRGSSRPSS